jgi:hypothetical protein
MSISQNFPEEGPTLNLNFAGSRTLDPRITFTRTSSATFMGRDGLVKIAPANSARFDHRYNSTTGEVESLGLLVEEQRTNLITNSQGTGMDDPNWGTNSNSVIIQTNSTIAPDGTLTANKVSASTVSELHLFNSNIFSATSGTTYTFSCFFKPAELSWVYFRTGGTPFGSNGFIFNITDGSLGVQVNTLDSSPIIVKYPNNWYKISITKTATSTGNGLLQIIVPNGNSTSIFSGDEISGFYVWGAQLEAGAFPTSYIPTTTSTVTRTADNVSMVGENFSSWYNQNEGTLYSKLNTNPNSVPISFDIGSVGTRMQIFINSSNILSNAYFSSGNSIVSFLKGTVGDFFKIATTYKLNDYAISRDGDDITTDTDAEVLPFTKLILGSLGNNTFKMTGHISQLTYYPRRLTNAQLVTLTR